MFGSWWSRNRFARRLLFRWLCEDWACFDICIVVMVRHLAVFGSARLDHVHSIHSSLWATYHCSPHTIVFNQGHSNTKTILMVPNIFVDECNQSRVVLGLSLENGIVLAILLTLSIQWQHFCDEDISIILWMQGIIQFLAIIRMMHKDSLLTILHLAYDVFR